LANFLLFNFAVFSFSLAFADWAIGWIRPQKIPPELVDNGFDDFGPEK
jgi:hypothetical protein